MWKCLNFLELLSDDLFGFTGKRKSEVRFLKEFIDLRKFRSLFKCVAKKILLQLNNNLVIFCFDSIIKIQVRHIWPNQNQVTFHKTRYVLSHMANASEGFDINQFVFRMIMPEEIILETRLEEFKRLAWIGQHYFLLNLHL